MYVCMHALEFHKYINYIKNGAQLRAVGRNAFDNTCISCHLGSLIYTELINPSYWVYQHWSLSNLSNNLNA
jgi:hypothetical protein